MIVVTGAAGFIGSCIVARLNELNINDLILVDNMHDQKSPRETSCPKRFNIENKKYSQYLDKKEFLDLIISNKLKKDIKCIIHMGACSSTTLQDAEYFLKNNYEYTVALAKWALKNNVRFIYASSAATYGDGSIGYNDDEDTIRKCSPLNLYGESKQKFDQWVLDNSVINKVVGLKFFNVFGPNEYHKGDMKSVIAKAYANVVEKGQMSLFRSNRDDYSDGDQKRDFVYVKDAVAMVLFFLEHPDVNGIYNVGTGVARSWNDLANSLFTAVGCKGKINYIDMPKELHERYQYFTQANISKIRSAGYKNRIHKLEDAILDYSSYLKDHRYW
jgi:ADP-L-glycero-D-manno-heptose 6-epimerase